MAGDPFGDDLPALHLLRLTMTDARGSVLSENTYWRYTVDIAMRELNQLAPTSVWVDFRPAREGYTATIRNTGRTVAAMVRLSLRERDGVERVLPTLYGDNYLWLLPGESRTVTVSPRRPVEHPRLLVEGYNVAGKVW